jgi:beta-galactosidase
LKSKFFACFAVCGLMTFITVRGFALPPNPRMDVNLDASWRFTLSNPSNAQRSNFNDSAWTDINLSHDWNNLDGQDGGNNYHRGIGWYRTHYVVDGNLRNKRFFLKFDGASLVTDIYINGDFIGEHQGCFRRVCF